MIAAVGASRTSVLLLTALALLSGGVAGALVEHKLSCRECEDPAWARRGKSWTDDQVERWSRELALEPAQRAELARTVAELKPRYDEVRATNRARRVPVDRDFQARLRRICAGGPQRARLDEIVTRDELRHAEYYGATPAPARPVEPPPVEDDQKTEPTSQ
jgi:hypothetical protein